MAKTSEAMAAMAIESQPAQQQASAARRKAAKKAQRKSEACYEA